MEKWRGVCEREYVYVGGVGVGGRETGNWRGFHLVFV